jgi:deoxyribonuclease-1
MTIRSSKYSKKVVPVVLIIILMAVISFLNDSELLTEAELSEETGQRIEDYTTARKVFWKSLYADGGETLYCQLALGTGYNKGVNIEHVFPMSWVAYSLRCGKRNQCRQDSAQFNRIEADLHNLYPARSDVNKARSNYRYAIISGESRPFAGCDFEFDQRSRMAEPSPQARGKAARAMLYMRDEYDLYLKPKLDSLMQDWDRKYPPDEQEHMRNNRIEALQGNRNPWIDRHRH